MTNPAMKLNPDTVRPGAHVRLGGDIEALVTANAIRQQSDGSLYVAEIELVWWDGSERHKQWVEPWEVWAIEETKGMGFQA